MATREEDFVEAAEKIADAIEKNKELAGTDAANEFIKRARDVRPNLDRISREGRDLVIGIVGCVKAGKSSFLNAIIFDGKETLPKAATPMTAALSRIRYSAEPYALVTFYSQRDWDNVCKQSEEYERRVNEEYERQCQDTQPDPEPLEGESDRPNRRRDRVRRATRATRKSQRPHVTREQVEAAYGPTLPEEMQACHELVCMARARDIDVSQYLNTNVRIELPSRGGYAQAIEDYVGASGKFTPIVNYIELGIDEPVLDGLVVVDTPGMNDPIVSRGRETEKFLKDADVIFVASAVGQFLVEHDVQLLRDLLPRNNVHRASIVGTQLDAGILQHKRRDKDISIASALRGSIAEYNKHASEIRRRLDETTSSVLTRRLMETDPIYVSAMMYSIGRKMENNEELSKDEAHIVQQLQSRFPDYDTTMDGPESFYVFSQIRALRKKFFEPAKRQKQEAIRERSANFATNQSAELARLLEQVNGTARMRQATLETASAGQLEKKLKDLTQTLNSIRSKVSTIFQNQAHRLTRSADDIRIEVAREMSNHTRLEEMTKEVPRREVIKTGWIRKEHRFWTELVQTARPNDVVENVMAYTTEAQRLINEQLSALFEETGLKRKLKECVIGAFDLADREFDEQEILGPIDALLNGLPRPTVSFEYGKEAEEEVDDAFGCKLAEGDEAVQRLRSLQTRLLRKALTKLNDKLCDALDEGKASMEREAAMFVDRIEDKISGDIDKMSEQLRNKKQYIQRYTEFIDDMTRWKTELLAFEE